MKVTFHLARRNSVGPTAIIAVIRHRNERVNFSSGLSVIPKYWNHTKHELRAVKGISHIELNTSLSRKKNKIEEAFRRYINDTGNPPTKSTLRELLKKEFKPDLRGSNSKKDLIEFFESLIASSKEGTRLQPNGKTISRATVKTYATTIKHLKTFKLKRRSELNFDYIDLDFYYNYVEFLTKELNLSPNAIGKDIQILKLVLREAFDRQITDKRIFDSKRFRVIREQPDTIYLTEDEVDELAQLNLAGNERLEIVRDLFLIGCYTGMRYSDYSNISKDQIDKNLSKIRYKQCKTGNLVVLPVKKEAKMLLAKYLDRLECINALPEVKYNSKTNAALKLIGKKCKQLKKNNSYKKTNGGITSYLQLEKWEKLSTHTARRTFATNELKNGTPISLIMSATGHSSEKSFWKYIRATSEEKANLLQIQWAKREKTLKAV